MAKNKAICPFCKEDLNEVGLEETQSATIHTVFLKGEWKEGSEPDLWGEDFEYRCLGCDEEIEREKVEKMNIF